MWPFKDKNKDKELVSPEKKQLINFRSDDTVYRRAENIWYALGFVNDRHGAIPSIAGYLAIYRDWDRAAVERRIDQLKEEKDN